MKQKTIIVVQGTANVGKSMTLSRLGQQLVIAGATTSTNISGSDYQAVLHYRSHSIGIQTFGDIGDMVTNGLEDLLQSESEIIAIASKRFGATVNAINNFARTNDFRVIWTTPYRVWDGSITASDIKDYSASHLKLMVDEIISGSI